jgi:hypothetical protein
MLRKGVMKMAIRAKINYYTNDGVIVKELKIPYRSGKKDILATVNLYPTRADIYAESNLAEVGIMIAQHLANYYGISSFSYTSMETRR